MILHSTKHLIQNLDVLSCDYSVTVISLVIMT